MTRWSRPVCGWLRWRPPRWHPAAAQSRPSSAPRVEWCPRRSSSVVEQGTHQPPQLTIERIPDRPLLTSDRAQHRASPDLATMSYRRGWTRGRRSSRDKPSLQAAQPTRSGRSPSSTNTRSARLGPAWRPRSARNPLDVVGSSAADGAARPLRPRARIRRASRWQSSYVDLPPMSVEGWRWGLTRGGRGSSIDQIDRATPARSVGSAISSCLRNSGQAPSGVSATSCTGPFPTSCHQARGCAGASERNGNRGSA